MSEDSPFIGWVLKRSWSFLRYLGTESGSKIYSCIHRSTSEYVLVKTRESKHKSALISEALALQALRREERVSFGVPRYVWDGVDQSIPQLTFLVTEHLGPSLQSLFLKCGRRFSLKSVLMLAIGCLEMLEFVHSNHFVHRNISPKTLLMGLQRESHVVFLGDFSLARRFRNPKNLSHLSFKTNQLQIEAPEFLSLNGQMGLELSRRDDLESLGLALVYFLQGGLPWEKLPPAANKTEHDLMTDRKLKTSVEELCHGLPFEFSTYLNYCRTLDFEEEPDYAWLKRLFFQLMSEAGFAFDFEFDWVASKPSDSDDEQQSFPSGIAQDPEGSSPLVAEDNSMDARLLAESLLRSERPLSSRRLAPSDLSREDQPLQFSESAELAESEVEGSFDGESEQESIPSFETRRESALLPPALTVSIPSKFSIDHANESDSKELKRLIRSRR